MEHTVTRSAIDVVGGVWMPDTTGATTYELSNYDVENIEQPVTRETVQAWLDTHSGDFKYVTDFRASLEVDGETMDFDWADPDSELTFNDCCFGDEDGF